MAVKLLATLWLSSIKHLTRSRGDRREIESGNLIPWISIEDFFARGKIRLDVCVGGKIEVWMELRVWCVKLFVDDCLSNGYQHFNFFTSHVIIMQNYGLFNFFTRWFPMHFQVVNRNKQTVVKLNANACLKCAIAWHRFVVEAWSLSGILQASSTPKCWKYFTRMNVDRSVWAAWSLTGCKHYKVCRNIAIKSFWRWKFYEKLFAK